MSDIYVGDIGTQFFVTADEGADISGVNTISFIFTNPEGVETTVVGSFFTDGTDGVALYTTTTAIFSVAGCWTLRLLFDYITTRFYSTTMRFTVKE